MWKTILLAAPLLAVAPVNAAPIVERDVVTAWATETVTRTASVCPSSSSVSEKYNPQRPADVATTYTTETSATPAVVAGGAASSNNLDIAGGPRPSPTHKPPPPSNGGAGEFGNTVYFVNWKQAYGPDQLPADKISRLLYSFADISDDGSVISSAPETDIKNAGQLFAIKKKNRNFKVILSIGGWTWSKKFPPAAATEAGRQKFASSAVKLMGDYGFDGIDIDWEYPENNDQAQHFVKLLEACRKELDAYASKNAKGYHFLITVASPAGASHYNVMDLKGMDQYVDGWNLMAYDYAGSWDSTSGHQANVFADTANAAATKFTTERAVQDYKSKGVDPRKIMLGVPLYGRAFEGTAGPGQSYNGVGPGESEAGVWPYKDLPKAGAQEVCDKTAIATYSYDASTRELITYDNVESATLKADYLRKQGLGGAVYWEASGDRSDDKSLIKTVAKQMGKLDSTENWLSYPGSPYDSIRSGA